MHAVIVIGHGSLRSASGAAMIRITARLRQLGMADVAEAAFLNFSRPSLADAIEKCLEGGATEATIQPYFLLNGAYVQNDLPKLIRQVSAGFPQLALKLSAPFLDHPGMSAIALDRIQEACGAQGVSSTDALVMMAHGTPLEEANAPLESILRVVAERAGFQRAAIAYLECNRPSIPEAIDSVIDAGATRVVAMPYFLHMGRHVRDDLPQLIDDACLRHPATPILLGRHLDYDLRLVDVIRDRLANAAPLPDPAVE